MMRSILTALSTLSLISILSGCATNGVQTESTEQNINEEASVANVQMGMAYLGQDKTVAAKDKFMKALQESPNLPSSWYGMAYYHEVTGELEKANQEYRKAIEVAENSGPAHNNYGTFLCRHGEYRDAIDQFKLAIAQPNYMQDGAAYENAGICALQIPDKTLAYQFFQKALLNNPNLTNALLHLGELSYDYKDYTTARNCLNRYLKLHDANEDSNTLAIQLAAKGHDTGIVAPGNIMVNQRFTQMKAQA